MNRHADRIPSYLGQILESIDLIETYLDGVEKVDFFADRHNQDAVIRRLEIIGEAASRIDKADIEFIGRNPRLQLKGAYGMRNRLSHGYDQINLDTVWIVVKENLPQMRTAIAEYLATHSP